MKSKQKARLVLVAVYVASVAVSLNQFKVPPTMQVLMTNLNVDTITGGWLMSSFAVAALILGIPAAFVLGRLGPRTSGLIGLGCTILGSVIGALANSATMLLLGRAVEGVGLGLVGVIAPAVISMWFPPEDRSVPMGIWASWAPVGAFIMLNVASPLLAKFGWQGIWWFGALIALVAFILYALVVSTPAPGMVMTETSARESDTALGKALVNRSSWILALAFATFTFTLFAYITWAPSYLSNTFEIGTDAASFDVSLCNLASIPSTIIAGWVLSRVRNRGTVLMTAFLILGVIMLWSFRLGSVSAIVPFALLLGFIGAFIPTTVFTLAPETQPSPQLSGLALGIINVGQSAGALIGPPVIGAVVSSGNWAAAVAPMIVALAIGLLASLLFQRWQTLTDVEHQAQTVSL